jgi:DNA-binding NarL/FixJ family response regulator
VSLPPDEAHTKLADKMLCDMLVYSTGGVSPSSPEVLAEIRVLHKLCPEAAIVILTDDDSLEGVFFSMNFGVRGYLSSSIAPELASQVLSFVLRGGTYFPSDAILAALSGSNQILSGRVSEMLPRQQKQTSLAEPVEGVRLCSGPSNSVQISETAATIHNGRACATSAKVTKLRLTEGQRAVFSHLCRGDPNKTIARNLSMTEMTVKVHVREIMRKLGVTNRTQIAIVAHRHGLVVDRTDDDPAGYTHHDSKPSN